MGSGVYFSVSGCVYVVSIVDNVRAEVDVSRETCGMRSGIKSTLILEDYLGSRSCKLYGGCVWGLVSDFPSVVLQVYVYSH